MIKIEVKFTDPHPAGMARDYNEALKRVWFALGSYWKYNFYHKHFTRAGAREYGYGQRKGEGQSGREFWKSYTGRKQRTKGHQDPLVFSGKSRELGFQGPVRATKNGVRIVIPAPALNIKNPNSRIDMRKEMETISVSELKELEKVAKTQLELQLTRLQAVHVDRLRERAGMKLLRTDSRASGARLHWGRRERARALPVALR